MNKNMFLYLHSIECPSNFQDKYKSSKHPYSHDFLRVLGTYMITHGGNSFERQKKEVEVWYKSHTIFMGGLECIYQRELERHDGEIRLEEEEGWMARRHPCPSEEHGGAVGGSSTKMEQDAPELGENEA